MLTFTGATMRHITDRDLLVIKATTSREIFVKLPVTQAFRRSFILMDGQCVLTTGLAFRQAGLEKEYGRGEIEINLVPEHTKEVAQSMLARNKLVSLLDEEVAALLRPAASEPQNGLIADKDAAEEEAYVVEGHKQRDRELAQQLKDRERFLAEEALRNKPVVSLTDAVALQEGTVHHDDLVVEDAKEADQAEVEPVTGYTEQADHAVDAPVIDGESAAAPVSDTGTPAEDTQGEAADQTSGKRKSGGRKRLKPRD